MFRSTPPLLTFSSDFNKKRHDNPSYPAGTDGDRNIAVSPFSGEFTRLVCFPFTSAWIDMLRRQREDIYRFTMAHGERIYRIDPEQKRAQWLFNQSGERYRFDDPAARPVVLKGGFWQMNRPWCFRGKILFSANYTPG